MALEVTGVEGTFSTCAKDVLAMLREMANDILPSMDIFVEDPLLRWAGLADGDEGFAVDREFMLAAIKRRLTVTATVAEDIRTLIVEAMAPERLARMNPEWMPWWRVHIVQSVQKVLPMTHASASGGFVPMLQKS
jgi:phosphatidylinositol kinase/protein kinase (PI-3  family)